MGEFSCEGPCGEFDCEIALESGGVNAVTLPLFFEIYTEKLREHLTERVKCHTIN